MPKRKDIKKVLIIGSGPIVIGQAAEFDYSGTQACRALKEEGIEVVLVNSNPATIMTDTEIADRVYIEPISVDYIEEIIKKERPQGLLAGLGGQTALNMAFELAEAGILEKYGVCLLGTSLETIKKAEDRELFKKTMIEIGEPVPKSIIAHSVQEAIEFAREVGYPVIVRPAYTLGGTGGGIAYNEEELRYIASKGLKLSLIHQVLIEQSVLGWKEIEYEVMRDSNDNCITVCNMENIDPVGIHTGDSIVVAPSQTLSDKEYQMLRSASLNIIRSLKIEGGCNVQFALNPNSMEYVVIEVNPRVSRSSALASKATGYPIARIAAKIAIGLTLDEIINPITQNTYASFEPSIDYVVVKVPRWPFDKFEKADRRLGTQMKSTGEVMAIGRTFEEAFLKAIDSLDVKINYQLGLKKFEEMPDDQLLEYIKTPNDERVFAICEALSRNYDCKFISDLSKIDYFFIEKFKNIVDMSKQLKKYDIESLPYDLLQKAKRLGFGDSYIANLLKEDVDEVIEIREKCKLKPSFKMVDTCAGEFEAKTPYFYSTYEKETDLVVSSKPKAIVIGSGPIRIGQGIEFDYCCVHSIFALKEEGVEAIIINNNPETVSTDFDTSDKLFFEPLTKECVLDIIKQEKPMGVIVQFGGQTAINMASYLAKNGVKILGTSMESIDTAEDRDKFLNLLKNLNIPYPPGGAAYSLEDAVKVAQQIGYPVLVRPSYVLGGRAMEIVYSREELEKYIKAAIEISIKHPILIDKYILGKEAEVDGISDGEDVLIPGIMEHIERAGVHSGDSMAVFPPHTLSERVKEKIVDYTIKLARALRVVGLFNIQFVIDKDENVYVIEVNPRASRTVPILSKVTGIPMIKIATKLILGKKLKDLGYQTGLVKEPDFFAVKAPVFSFSKLSKVDAYLGPEMKSTGEVLGISKNLKVALYKAFISSNHKFTKNGSCLILAPESERDAIQQIIRKLYEVNFKVFLLDSMKDYIKGLNVEFINKETAQKLLLEDKFSFVINIPSKDKMQEFGFVLRRLSVEFGITTLTSIDTALYYVDVLSSLDEIEKDIYCLNDLFKDERMKCYETFSSSK
ncbi:carbamoyl-phosphate synthase large subunit [Caldicellulosiruptor bescii]|uniref:Carbamoyl phosphate synthase large chain n=2 Tax=Caldicellulosiruptor bescii TaxID=31899 RepID=B9MJY1_CALBD|nr:carbamoyl-phosphate synthase (glutamine-hydrolyzing) large subunit [Caldicellulosiruptor bescii]ACM60639.1 carbamoyl-phosphate synthase, large subunit [Caldicellulosiruptor bescii DSM 6725]PBC88048.1 carbamoyl-phosphate synthase large subunit [Caldicellulosiruptor bescii]PBC90980.1 carbamoyl-phosphate synthase large subunit [Caldicellulosiruptor bescii]PBD03587.1 carbamoyl-phosphate synthase large subunit [Caldicellulosiruptor bescii]PBD06778.1 carbamoyl-phosphate synthase large subunit [Ca